MLLLTFHCLKQVTWPCLISLGAEMYHPTGPRRKGELEYLCVALVTTRLSFYWQCNWTCSSAILTLAVLPASRLCLLLLFQSTHSCREKISLAEETRPLLPVRERNWSFIGDQSYLIKHNSQKVSKHLLHQEFSFSQSGKCCERLSPCCVPSGDGSAPSVPFSWEVVSGNHGTDHPETGQTGKNKNKQLVAFSKPRLFYKLPVSDMLMVLVCVWVSASPLASVCLWAISSSGKWSFVRIKWDNVHKALTKVPWM